MNENKITLYFRDDNPESVFAYTILSQLGRRKSKAVTQLVFGLAEKYGVSDIQDLTLRQLAELKSLILSDLGISETVEKPETMEMPSVKPKRAARKPKETRQAPASKVSESVPEALPEGQLPAETAQLPVKPEPAPVTPVEKEISVVPTVTEEPVAEPAPVIQSEPVKSEPVAEPADAEPAESDDEGYLNEDLLSQLGAFYG